MFRPFLDETAEEQDIEVGRDHDVDQSFQLQDLNESNIKDAADANDTTMANDDIAEIPMDDQSGIGGGPDISAGFGDAGFGDSFGFGDVSIVPSEVADGDHSVANISAIAATPTPSAVDAENDVGITAASAMDTPAAGSRPPTRFGDEIDALKLQELVLRERISNADGGENVRLRSSSCQCGPVRTTPTSPNVRVFYD